MSYENENPPLCFERLEPKLKKMFIALLLVNIIGFLSIFIAQLYIWKRLQKNIFFTYNMNKEATEQITGNKIYWDSGIKQIIVIPNKKP